MTTLYVCSPGCETTIEDDADAFERHRSTCPRWATIAAAIGQRVLDLAEDHDCDAYDCDLLDGPCILRLLIDEARERSGDEEYRAETARFQEEIRERIASVEWPERTFNPAFDPAAMGNLMALADFSTLPEYASSTGPRGCDAEGRELGEHPTVTVTEGEIPAGWVNITPKERP